MLRYYSLFVLIAFTTFSRWIGGQKLRDININGAKDTEVRHRNISDAPRDSFQSLFQNQDIIDGCLRNEGSRLSKIHQSEDFWSNVKVYHAEKELMNARPTHFIPLSSFDNGNETRGGLALFKNAIVQGQTLGRKMPLIYDCAGSIYGVGGCDFYDTAETIDGIKTLTKNLFAMNASFVTNNSYQYNPDDVTVFIGQFWDSYYYHSQVEVLPKLVYVLPYLKQRNENSTTTILGPRLSPERIDLALKLLGVGGRIKWEGIYDETKFVPKLVVPTATHCGEAQPMVIEKMQRIIDKNAPTVLANELKVLQSQHRLSSNNTRPLIVLQQRLESRKLLNHDELLLALHRKFGNASDIIVFKGNETPAQTAALHWLAGIVIGPHGAGLGNIIYCHRKAVAVIEMHPPKGNSGIGERGINYCHKRTAESAGLWYKMLVSAGPGEFGDFFTDVDAVLSEVEAALDWLRQQAAT